MQELSSGLARAPHVDHWRVSNLGVMESTNQTRDDVPAVVKPVVRPIQISGHNTYRIQLELLTVRLAHFNASNLGNGVRLIGCLQRSGK